MSSSTSHLLPLLEPNEHHQDLTSLTSPSQPSPSSSSQNLLKEQIKQYQPSQEAGEYVSQGGSSDHQSETASPPWHSSLESGSEYYGDRIKSDTAPGDKGSAGSWMSSKVKLMKTMMNTDRSMDALKPIRKRYWFQDPKQPPPSDGLASNSVVIRTCSDCNTTRTPLWRSGPRGPKSLCNACGIRQRKARRALAAASTANGVVAPKTPSVATKVHCSKKKPGKGHVGAHHKKQCKRKPNKMSGFEDFIVNLTKKLVLHDMFPQDEAEAAILLMALSCGLVNG